MLQSIEWARPEALWLLALPVLLLLFTRLNSRPPTLATGTLELWKQIAAGGASDGRSSERRVPLSIWMLALSLLAGALAASDPRPTEAARSLRFTCVVDTSPSMYLPSEEGTRIERSAALAEAWLAGNAEVSDEVLWVRFASGVRETSRGESLPVTWLTPPIVPEREPRWSDFDQVGTLWLTDRASALQNAAAVLVASGGEAVPGPVGATARTRFDWDGEQVVRVEGGAEVGVLSFAASEETRFASDVLNFARVWARDRGFAVEKDAKGARLELRAPQGSASPVALGRDGWNFEGEAVALPPGPGEVWLQTDGADFLRSSPGVIECGLVSTEKLGGDVASFAVSWGELFDRAVLPAPGVVSLSERVSAGAELVRLGSQRLEPVRAKPRPPGVLPAAWLATGAFLLALLATVLAKRS